MFEMYSSLQNLDRLKNWDISNKSTFSNMFEGCSSLQNLDGLKNIGEFQIYQHFQICLKVALL